MFSMENINFSAWSCMGRSVIRHTCNNTNERTSSSNAAWDGGNDQVSSGPAVNYSGDASCAATANAGAMAEEGGLTRGGAHMMAELS